MKILIVSAKLHPMLASDLKPWKSVCLPLHITGKPQIGKQSHWANAVFVYSEDLSLCYQFIEILNIEKLRL